MCNLDAYGIDGYVVMDLHESAKFTTFTVKKL